MIRKIIRLLAFAGLVTAHADEPPRIVDAAKIYPYVVPVGYFPEQNGPAATVFFPLGNSLIVAIVCDVGGMVRNVSRSDLVSLGLTEDEVRRIAIENLVSLAKSGAIGQARFVGPDQKPFVLFGGHWAAATCILLPDLREIGVKNVGSEELCVCIPHREALLMFAKGDQRYRDAMRAMIKERESDGRKPLTFAFFEITPEGIGELKEKKAAQPGATDNPEGAQ